MEPEGSLLFLPVPILSQIDPVHALPPPNPTSCRSILILFSHLLRGLPIFEFFKSKYEQICSIPPPIKLPPDVWKFTAYIGANNAY
jgi:hypothetical protein